MIKNKIQKFPDFINKVKDESGILKFMKDSGDSLLLGKTFMLLTIVNHYRF